MNDAGKKAGTITKRMLLNVRKGMEWRAWVTCACAFLWWGVFYPELCFPEETYQTVDEEGLDCVANTSGQELLKVAGDDVVVRSRLVEWLEEYLK